MPTKLGNQSEGGYIYPAAWEGVWVTCVPGCAYGARRIKARDWLIGPFYCSICNHELSRLKDPEEEDAMEAAYLLSGVTKVVEQEPTDDHYIMAHPGPVRYRKLNR